MKKTAVCLSLISLLLLFTATLLQAVEHNIVFNTERIEHKSGTSSERCQELCRKRSGPDVKELRTDGWIMVSSSSKEAIGERYSYTPCNTCEPHGCTCIGTEYILQRESPAPKVEISINELDLLKSENASLKQEITLLKLEIEKLKNHIKSKQD
ncbi:MAG: hypothetical protein HXX11_20155 [Desulfuromonadales bacterium]|nr:hypothetical protein [Desulfuromonadales bacterium]